MKTQRLFWLSLALVALLLVGGVVVGFQQYKTTLSAHERSEVTQTAAQVQSDLNRSITGLERAVEIAAANPALTRHGTTAQRRALRALVERSAFSGASVIAANGTMTNIVGNVSAERRQQLVGSSFESRTYFRRAIAGRTYVSDPVAAESGNYIVTVSAPVRRGGRIVATVNAALYLSHPSRRAFFARFNSTLTSRQGLTIYARNGTRIYDVDPAPPTDLIVRNETVPATGWTVSVQESRAPIQSAIRAVTYLQVGVAFVVLGVVLGFGWWVYRRNITQLDRLREGFDALADGEYGTELSLGGADEWERIEARFNEFSDTLETEMARRETRRQELEEEHQKYTTLVEQSQDGIAIVREGRFAFANRAMADLVGCSPAELEGRALTDIVAPEDRDLVRERYEKRVAGENPPDRYDIEILTDGGERRHIDLRVSRISYRNEPATLATFTDVTDRRERERRLRQFREAVEQAGHAVYITDPDGTITYVNPAFEETTGYDASEALGETPRILQSGEYDDGFYADLWETITSGERWHHEMHDETSEGTDVILDQTISPVERDDGEIEAFVAVARDVTERKAYEKRLEEQRDGL
ncbi:MAG: PAS domain S-box protein, partial [Haloquadratum sp.]